MILTFLSVVNMPFVVFQLVGLHLCLLYLATNLELTKLVVAPVSNKAFKITDSFDFCFLAKLRNTMEPRLNLGFFVGKLPTRRSLKVKFSFRIKLLKHSSLSSGQPFQSPVLASEALSASGFVVLVSLYRWSFSTCSCKSVSGSWNCIFFAGLVAVRWTGSVALEEAAHAAWIRTLTSSVVNCFFS